MPVLKLKHIIRRKKDIPVRANYTVLVQQQPISLYTGCLHYKNVSRQMATEVGTKLFLIVCNLKMWPNIIMYYRLKHVFRLDSSSLKDIFSK